MKKIMSLLILSINSQLIAEDLIQCVRERPATRQFCYIKNTVFESSLSFSTVATLTDSSGSHEIYSVDLFNLFQDASIELLNDSGVSETLPINSLRPSVLMSANWNNAAECRRNGLWDHQVFMRANAQQHLSRMELGLKNYEISLADFFTNDFSPIYINSNADNDRVIMSSNIDFLDVNYDPNLPYPQERIPASCKLDITTPVLSFDATEINDDLAFIKQLVQSKSTTIMQATVIHTHLIDQQKGAICGTHTVAQKLKAAEVLFPSDSLFYLSLESKNYLQSLLVNAKSLGVSELAGVPSGDLLSYLDTNFAALEASCGLPSSYEVDKDVFLDSSGAILNHQGYNNALLFEREIANLESLLEATWGLIRASEVGADTSADVSWAFVPDLYVHLPH